MSNPIYPVDKIQTQWTCSKCGETSECHVSDLTESGIPMCGDCGDDMEVAPAAVLEIPMPGAGDPAPNTVNTFDCLTHVDWELLYDQKLALLDCLESRQVTPSGVEALRGIVEMLDALQDDAAAAGIWAFPDPA